MNTLRFQTASYKVGKTYWRIQIMEDNDAIICPSLSASGEFERGTQYSTQYQYHDGATWKNDTEHPRYDSNNGTTNGLPKGIATVYYSNEKIIKFWTDQNNKASQLDHCTDIAEFMKEYEKKYPVENCEVIEYDANGNIIKTSPLMVEGEGAPQYTMFDLPKDTQLALL